MKKLGIGILIAAGVLLLVVVTGGTVFYFKYYKPIASPLMAMAGPKRIEDARLLNKSVFVAPGSGEITEEAAARFVSVEEAVEKQVASGSALLERKMADLERASEARALSIRDALAAFGDLKSLLLNAKIVQVDALNKANFSKAEFEWVRRELYRAAGVRLSQLDVSDLLAGVREPSIEVRRVDSGGAVPAQNERLARPLAARLQAWQALGFFGL